MIHGSRRHGIPWALLGLVITVLALGSCALDRQSRQGTVSSREERLNNTLHSLLPTVVHRFFLGVRLNEPLVSGLREVIVEVPASSYDRLAVGSTVVIHVSPPPFTAATLEGADGFMGLPWARFQGLADFLASYLALAAVIAVPVLLLGRGKVRLLALGVIALAATVIAAATHRQWEARSARAAGSVERVSRVTSALLLDPAHRRRRAYTTFVLPQPYDEIELTFQPPGPVGPVRVVDRLDVAAPSPRAGDSVTLGYDPAWPRDAWIIRPEGTRTYGWKALRARYEQQAFYLLMPVALVAALLVFVRRRAAARSVASRGL